MTEIWNVLTDETVSLLDIDRLKQKSALASYFMGHMVLSPFFFLTLLSLVFHILVWSCLDLYQFDHFL